MSDKPNTVRVRVSFEYVLPKFAEDEMLSEERYLLRLLEHTWFSPERLRVERVPEKRRKSK